MEAPDLATVKDFLRFKRAAGKGMVVEQTTCDSLNTFAEWFFAGFTRVTDTKVDKEYRNEVYNVSIFHHLWPGVRLMNHRDFYVSYSARIPAAA